MITVQQNLYLTAIAIFLLFLGIQKENPKTAFQLNPTLPTSPAHFCFSDVLHEKALVQQENYEKKHHLSEQKAYAHFQEQNLESASSFADYTLPVVVHVIHNNGPENISDALILQGIQHLNDAYSNTGVYDPSTGVNTQIEFCLAERDPDGNPTSGITRTVSPLTSFTIETQDIAMKDLSRWEPTEYINLWLVAEICSGSVGCGVAGYAYFPAAHGNPEDGIVLEARWMGSTPGGSAALAHEAGHYLGLYHTFQGACTNNDCLNDGDRVCDTPPDQSTAAVPCSATANSCMTDVNSGDVNNPFTSDQDDMFWNYMDYGDWDCYSAFTQGQTDRMSFFIDDVRSSLLSSSACLDPCLSPIEALFVPSTLVVNIGETVNFSNQSSNSSQHEWDVDGTVFSNGFNASYTFNTLGSFDVSLSVGNADPNCTDTYTVTIEVLCPVQAIFTASNLFPEPGQTVNFSNNSSNATVYNWTIDGLSFSTNTNSSYTFPISGEYTICLEADNTLCEAEECLTVLVFENTQDCEDTFFKTIGEANEDEYLRTLLSIDNDRLLAGGRKGNQSLLMLMDNNANPIWQRTFNFTNLFDDIYDLKIDSEGYLYGSGFGSNLSNGNSQAFAFRYDYENDNMLWIQRQEETDRARYYNIIELPDGNFVALGQIGNIFGGNGLGCDGSYTLLERNTGNLLDRINYNLGSCETFIKSILHNNSIYATGRYNFAGGGTDKMRAALSELDFSGNEIWSRLYIASVGVNARLYSNDLLVENGSIYAVAQGDFNGTSTSNVEMFLTRTDLQGQANWTQEYDIPSAGRERFLKLISLPDGFLTLANFEQAGEDIALIKTSKSGQVQWSKKYSSPGDDEAFSILQKNGFIYFVGYSTGLGTGGRDALIAKLSLEGEVLEPCEYIQDLELTSSTVTNTYDGPHSLDEHDYNYGLTNINATSLEWSMIEEVHCSSPCVEICDNGIDDDDDGYVDCYDNECFCQDDACSTTDLEQNFAMRLSWQSTVDLASVDATPVVAHLNPQVDDIPEIIVGISSPLVSSQLSDRLLIFRGDGVNNTNPRELNIPGDYDMYPDAKPVVGDVNGDGIPELIISCADRRIRVFSNYNESGTNLMDLIAVSDQQVAERDYVAYLADFDGDGIAEIYAGNEIYQFDFSGSSVGLTRVLQGTGSAGWVVRRDYQFKACSPIAADVLKEEDCNGDPDCDGLELVAGEVIYSIDLTGADGDGFQIKIQRDLNQLQNQHTYFEGYTSVADLDLDGVMDVVVAGREDAAYGVYVWNKNGLIQFFPKPFSSPNDLFGTLPCVANVYDDTQSGASVDLPEIVVSYNNGLICYNLNAPSGVWWDLNATDASGLTGVTVFDFNGDGLKEIIYRDEENLRIMYGGASPFPSGVDANRNWETVIAGSGTFDEHPVVADVDNDKQAEIVVTSFTYAGNNTPAADYRGRLRVFESDPNEGGPWLSSRDVWNQYSYFVVNVNDDLSIPIDQQEHHLVLPGAGNAPRPLNNFLAQSPILNNSFEPFLPLPDAELMNVEVECGLDSFEVNLMICNRGSAALPELTPVSFYLGDPQNSVATWWTTRDLLERVEVDECQSFQFKFENMGVATIYVVVNDDHSLNPPFDLATDFPVTSISECDYTNNIGQFELMGSFLDLELGPDIIVCENGVFDLDAGEGYASYRWQDGSTEASFTAWEPGIYWVEVTGACGDLQRDSVTIDFDPVTQIDLGGDTVLCTSTTLTLSVEGFDDYQWLPADGLDCSNCPTVNVSINIPTTLTVVASTDAGCISVDSIHITLGEDVMVTVDTTICQGESFFYDGIEIPAGEMLTLFYTAMNGCDSVIQVNVMESAFSASFEQIDTVACLGETVFFENAEIPADSIAIFNYTNIHGCDSVIVINVVALDTFANTEEQMICAGDSALIFGQYQQIGGWYSQTFAALNGCDSTASVLLNVLAPLDISLDIIPTCIDDSTGSVDANVSGGLAPYSFSWSTNSTSSGLSELKEGAYSLTVVDDFGCEEQLDFFIENSSVVEIPVEVKDVTCFGDFDGALVIDSFYQNYWFAIDTLIFQQTLRFINMPADVYTLYVQDPNGCIFEQMVEVDQPRELIVQLPRDTTILLGCSIALDVFVNSTDSLSYLWDPLDGLDCGDCPSVNVQPMFSTMYQIQVENEAGCEAEDDIFVGVDKPRKIYIPNVFSPNGDGINDVFTVYGGKGVDQVILFRIFDRWGELVYEVENFPVDQTAFGWDGRFRGQVLNNAVFVYYAEVRFFDGTIIKYTGDVLIMK